MKVKINLNPQTLEEAGVSYSVLRGSYMKTRKLFPELGEARKPLLGDYLSSLEEHERLFERLQNSRPVQREYSKSLIVEGRPEIYEGIGDILQEIELEKTRMRTALTKIPQAGSPNSAGE